MLQRRRTRRHPQGFLIRLAPSPCRHRIPGPVRLVKRRPPKCWQPALINGDFIGHNISAAHVLLLELLIVLNYSWHFLKMTLRLLQSDARRHDCLVTLSFVSCQAHLSALLFFLFSACPLGPEPLPSGSLRTHFHSGPGAEPVSIPVQNRNQTGASCCGYVGIF